MLRDAQIFPRMHSAIVVLMDVSGSMSLPGFEVPRDLAPNRARGDVRVNDRVCFTMQKAAEIAKSDVSVKVC